MVEQNILQAFLLFVIKRASVISSLLALVKYQLPAQVDGSCSTVTTV